LSKNSAWGRIFDGILSKNLFKVSKIVLILNNKKSKHNFAKIYFDYSTFDPFYASCEKFNF